MLDQAMNLRSTASSRSADPHPRKNHASRALSTRGMTLVELICVTVVLSILVLMILPAVSHSHRHPRWVKCVNNLKNVGLAFRIYATDNNDLFPFQVSTNNGGTLELIDVAAQFRILSNELSTPKILLCPRDYPRLKEATNWAKLGPQNISFFVGLDASETNPASILSGDAGFSVNGAKSKTGLHRLTGADRVEYPKKFHDDAPRAHLCMGDGSVAKIGNTELPKYLTNSRIPTNRFVSP